MEDDLVTGLWTLAVLLVQVAGLYYAVQAVMTSRTPQAALGWGVGLILVPWVTIPIYWVFGESRFAGYVLSGTGENPALDASARSLIAAASAHEESFSGKYSDAERIAKQLCGVGATGGNRVQLLVDGEAAFRSIFEAIDAAREFVVVQFYIIHDDGLGGRLARVLLNAAGRGVSCRVLYDSVGSKGLDEKWLGPLREAGVEVRAFVTNRQRGRRFQINFRNHRKLVVADGVVGFVGGLNAGDEYLGLGPLGPWRDTHVRVEGPAVVAMLVPFIEDWSYAGKEVLSFKVNPVSSGGQRALAFDSGPSEVWRAAPAVYLEVLHDARERLWIASPYFVPDPATRTALAHAALRGVDVRILLPGKPDHTLPWLSAYTFYPQMKEAGVRIWRHGPGFMHQKVLLSDNDLAIVGSINFDYRSFMINFEAAVAVEDRTFAREVEAMLLNDFSNATEEDLSLFDEANFFFRLKCRLASLISPEQ